MGQPNNFTKEDDTSETLLTERILQLQKITGMLLFYAEAIDLTLLVTLVTIAAEKLVEQPKQINH